MRAETAVLAEQGTISLSGEMDLSTVGVLYEAVRSCLDARPARVLIALDEVSFCDCVGIRALLQAQAEVVRAGAVFELRGPLRPLLARLVDHTRTAEQLGLSPPPATAPPGPAERPEGAERS
ncbi:STAS domain-containing protein [Streptomyces sp. NPDC002564]|uniref:STAS domain-containing protein n=1 Tax=Streptomyces sp. NPDC002564 TaxID=3364649 RepID=UPI00368EB313